MSRMNVYLPDMADLNNSKKIVINSNDLEARLAAGYIGEDAWKALCAQKAAEAYQAWLVDPATEEERFQMLRAARDAKISWTDYLMAADYPIEDAAKVQVAAYRQALRDLPAQAGAPWDGGGALTPWPEMPVVANIREV